MNRKKLGFIIGFFTLLIVGFYFSLAKLIPGYAEAQLPVVKVVEPFRFTDQEGKLITKNEVTGKVYVAEFFFTTCKGICPKLNGNIKKISQDFAADSNFLILSHTVDPEVDTVARMKKYADSLGANPARWLFLTGRKDSLYLAARNSYLLDDPKNNLGNIEEQLLHTQLVALVNKSGRVRNIYDGLKKDELSEMEKDIKSLLKESPSAAPRFTNSLFNNNPG